MTDHFFIPTGDYLRQFIGNSSVKPTDIKAILKKRGVFSSSNDKVVLGPILIKTGVSPEEFEELKESIKTKEENPKIHTRKLKWHGSDTLIDAIPDNFDFSNLVNDPFGVLSIDNDPIFTAAGDGRDPNHLIAEIVIKRNDKTKNFGDDIRHYKCSIELKIDSNNNVDLDITMKHSSQETLNIVNKAFRRVHNTLKEGNHVTHEPVERIQFNDFSNESRIDFLLKLANFNIEYLQYRDIKTFNITPDDEVLGPVPDEIKWFDQKVKDLILKGERLDSNIFLKKADLKKHLMLHSITCNYDILDEEHEGSCVINIYFPDSNETGELTMEVGSLSLQKKKPSEQRYDIKVKLLKMLENKKSNLYNKYKK